VAAIAMMQGTVNETAKMNARAFLNFSKYDMLQVN
jgi:hypothetical protein